MSKAVFKPGDNIRAIRANTYRVVVEVGDAYTIVRSHDWSFARSIDNESLQRYWELDADGRGAKLFQQRC